MLNRYSLGQNIPQIGQQLVNCRKRMSLSRRWNTISLDENNKKIESITPNIHYLFDWISINVLTCCIDCLTGQLRDQKIP